MLYTIQECVNTIEVSKVDREIITVGIVTVEELLMNIQQFGFSAANIKECTASNIQYRCTMDVYDDYSFGMINLINLNNIFSKRDKFCFFIKSNLFLLVIIQDEEKKINEVFEETIHRLKPESTTLEKVIFAFFDRLFSTDSMFLEKMSYQITLLEDEIAEGKVQSDFNMDLLNRKKMLLVLRNYYEQLIDIGESLQENENDLFIENRLRYFKIFTDKMERLSNNTQILRDNLVQLREAYQAYLDYSLNTIMKMFTIVTIIFLPLTLLVGWYGMNFTSMPELTWKYGYLFVIALAVIVVGICIYIFKRKKLI